ncbi:hypothetical protein UFOVP1655_132 [uncultured Caudovirales phage]|jgi:hypothetical protein|uniref:Uncharacterized protein n=1 Tax=uncultured Caudovirales phage TaxID=2100421 RepID=A0A6J5T4A0_9CAUD|nr:hypothetical protein UFOVP1655_132 [uncultured Caudovirales phage]
MDTKLNALYYILFCEVDEIFEDDGDMRTYDMTNLLSVMKDIKKELGVNYNVS